MNPNHPNPASIVITGMGWITPLGHDLETVWRALLAGESGVGPITRFDASTFPANVAAEVRDYDWRDFVTDPMWHGEVSLNTAFALGAASQAWKQAGLDQYDRLDPYRLGIYLGSGEGVSDFDALIPAHLAAWDAEAQQVDAQAWIEAVRPRLSAAREAAQEPNMPLSHLALEFDARGPCYNCLTACAAATQAIGEAAELLRRGDADVMITGGSHTMLNPFDVTGFIRLTALSNRPSPDASEARQEDPGSASRPFSLDRDGFVMGEGAGILILETLEHAVARGAKPLAEVAGFGSTADAYRVTDIHPTGRGAVGSMQGALDDAGVTVDDIDYISAHGTGTKENDSIETRAIKTVFGDRAGGAGQVPISSIKSMLGHLIAAAGACEAIVCALAIRDNVLPPTMNLNVPDPACDLDYIPHVAREAKVDVCLSNSFGFGGQNDTLVIRRV